MTDIQGEQLVWGERVEQCQPLNIKELSGYFGFKSLFSGPKRAI